jgi:hypothetical protein
MFQSRMCLRTNMTKPEIHHALGIQRRSGIEHSTLDEGYLGRRDAITLLLSIARLRIACGFRRQGLQIMDGDAAQLVEIVPSGLYGFEYGTFGEQVDHDAFSGFSQQNEQLGPRVFFQGLHTVVWELVNQIWDVRVHACSAKAITEKIPRPVTGLCSCEQMPDDEANNLFETRYGQSRGCYPQVSTACNIPRTGSRGEDHRHL